MLLRLLKIVLLGDGGAGKTSLREAYLGKKFRTNYLMTIGADFAVKEFEMPTTNDGHSLVQKMKFQIWDMAGQQRFSEVRKLYYSGAMGGLLVFDISRRETFENLMNWIEEFYSNTRHGACPLIILGNKSDLRQSLNPSEAVSSEEGEIFIQALNNELPSNCGFESSYLETSAKTGVNVNEAFRRLGQNILQQSQKF